MNLAQRFFSTDDSRFALVSRVALGAVIFPHGAQKLLGWFGGHGVSGTVGFFSSALHVPAPLTFLVIVAEFFGALGLIVGLGTRLAALGVTLTMLGAVAMVHASNGFFMNWGGTQHGEGFEYHLLALAISIPLTVWGAGALSADREIARRLAAASPSERGAPVAATA